MGDNFSLTDQKHKHIEKWEYIILIYICIYIYIYLYVDRHQVSCTDGSIQYWIAIEEKELNLYNQTYNLNKVELTVVRPAQKKPLSDAPLDF